MFQQGKRKRQEWQEGGGENIQEPAVFFNSEDFFHVRLFWQELFQSDFFAGIIFKDCFLKESRGSWQLGKLPCSCARGQLNGECSLFSCLVDILSVQLSCCNHLIFRYSFWCHTDYITSRCFEGCHRSHHLLLCLGLPPKHLQGLQHICNSTCHKRKRNRSPLVLVISMQHDMSVINLRIL